MLLASLSLAAGMKMSFSPQGLLPKEIWVCGFSYYELFLFSGLRALCRFAQAMEVLETSRNSYLEFFTEEGRELSSPIR